jgi:nickel/cobalt exporter
MNAVETSLIGVIAIGLLHGLEPGHGWPIALLYSARTARPTFFAFVSSGIISFFHFISSIAVVLVYFLASSLVDFTSPILKYIAFAALAVLAVKLFLEKADDQLENQHGTSTTTPKTSNTSMSTSILAWVLTCTYIFILNALFSVSAR